MPKNADTQSFKLKFFFKYIYDEGKKKLGQNFA